MKNNPNRQYKKTSLEFKTEKETNGRKKFTGVLFVLIGIIVIGCISLLLLLREYDFDIDNIIGRNEQTTMSNSETTSKAEIEIEGKKTFLVVCSDNDSKYLHFASLIDVDLQKGSLDVTEIDVLKKRKGDSFEGSLDSIFKQNSGSMLIMKSTIEAITGKKINRYIRATDSSFKGMIKIFNGVTAQVGEKVSFSYKGVGYIIDEGRQTLTADMGFKYMYYLSQQNGNKPLEMGKYLIDIVRSVLTEQNLGYADSYYNKLRNILDTDISAFDFSGNKQVLEIFVSKLAQNTDSAVEVF